MSVPELFSYRDQELYSHHSRDGSPEPEGFSVHAHEWMEVLYFRSVSGSCLVEGTRYPLEPGDILIMRAAETHRVELSPDTPYERIAIHFSPALLAGLDPEGKLLQPFLDRPLGRRNLYPAAADPEGRLRAAFAEFGADRPADLRLNLLGRLLVLLTGLAGVFQQDLEPEPTDRGLPGQVVAYVNRHLFEDISLQSAADRFYRSRSQISRVFRQATGSSFWDYVTRKRLMAARAMIQRGEPAGTACIHCGFADYSSFFRAYRSHFGHSPKEDSPKK